MSDATLGDWLLQKINQSIKKRLSAQLFLPSVRGDDRVFAQRLRARWVKPFLLIAFSSSSSSIFFLCCFGRVILLIQPGPSVGGEAGIFKAALCCTYRLKQPVSENRSSFEGAVLTRPENKRLHDERNSQSRTCSVLKNSSEMQIVQLQRGNECFICLFWAFRP